ncbi:MAG: protein kinase [Planctomycetes bacterium]|nr:protein kinase [Planctomycetota bacterium]MCB9917036.1 protein kinase [Planctomycetota bacterium]
MSENANDESADRRADDAVGPEALGDDLLEGGLRFAFREDTSEPSATAHATVDAEVFPSRYEGVERIATGGVGIVYRGRDTELGREVALKTLHAEFRQDTALLTRFFDEARISSQLEHPGIVPIYELGRARDTVPYIAMRLIGGSSFATLLRAREDSNVDRHAHLAIFEKVCQTVGYAHERGVLHRDLKPANVMVGQFGEVQVVDWGFAKVVDGKAERAERAERRERVAVEPLVRTLRSDDVETSRSGSVFGTPAYMPPEQANGDVAKIDERADVFALGAMLCEILTGAPPYRTGEADDREIVLERARAGDLTHALTRLDACTVDRPLAELATLCLSVDRERRPANAVVVAARVSAWARDVEDHARAAEQEAFAQRVRADGERRARKLTLALASTILILVVAGALTWGTLAAIREREERERLERATAARSEAQDARARADAAFSLDSDDGNERSRDAWARALAASERVRSEDPASTFPDELRAAHGAAMATLDARARDAAMLDRLRAASLPDPRIDDARQQVPALHRRMREHFEAYAGIDIESAETEAAATRLDTAVRVELAAYLDLWAATIVSDGAREHLTEIASRIDPDELRMRMRRDLIVAPADPDRAGALLGECMREVRAPETYRLLMYGLQRAGLDDAARRAVLIGQILHPNSEAMQRAGALAYLSGPRQDWQSAVRALLAAAALRGRSNLPWIAYALERGGDSVTAGALYRLLIDREPDRVEWHLRYGQMLGATGRSAEARPHLERAAQSFDASIVDEATIALARIARGSGDMASAVRYAKEVAARNPDKSSTHLLLAELSRDPERRALELRKALPGTREQHALILHNLGSTLCMLGRVDEGLETIRRATEAAPDVADHRIGLAFAMLQTGRHAEALEWLDEAAAIDPGDARIAHLMADAQLELGRIRDEVRARERALALFSEDRPPPAGQHRDRGLRLGRDDYEQALSDAKARLARVERLEAILNGVTTSEDADRWSEIAELLAMREQYAAAARAADRAIALHTVETPSLDITTEAAIYAIASGFGRGKDAPFVTDAERAAARERGRARLVELLDRFEANRDRPGTARAIASWLDSLESGPVPQAWTDDAIATLPSEEQPAWRDLQRRLAALKK